jgi:hypothetical protein
LSFDIDDVSYGYYSKSVSREFSIGEIPEILITDEDTVISSRAYFYDSGGSSGSYSNYENDTITLNPDGADEYLMVKFLSFSLESGYDYLKIYDGENTGAELIGSYSGLSAPNDIVATNEAGALTFVFTSDNSEYLSGWEAEIRSVVVYDNQVTVSDIGGNPIEGAIVEFSGRTEIADVSGIVNFYNIPEGINYPLTIHALGYDDFENQINFFEDTSEEFVLEVSKYDVSFNLYDEDGSNPIEGAIISFDGKSGTSDANGEYVFNVTYSLNKPYIISKIGYDEVNGTVNVDADKTVEINMLLTFSVNFIVTDASSSFIDNVLVEFNSESKYTDTNGEAVFAEITPGDGLSFTLSKEGFWDYDSTLNVVDADLEVNAILSSTTGIIPINENNIKIYPNPSSGLFNLEILGSKNSTYQIKVFDVIGSIVYTKNIKGIQEIKEQIDISNKAKGIYFLSVESDNGAVLCKRIITK